MAIYAVASKKGGVGKSTTAVQIVTGLTKLGRRVLAVDADSDQTSMLLALTLRNSNELFAGIAATELSDGASLRTQVRMQAGNYDDVVIDVGAKDSACMRAALSVCDVMVFPFAPRSFDVWAFENTVNLVREVQAMRDFKVLAFLNKADPEGQGTDNEDAIAEVAAYGYPICEVKIGDRKAISHASAAGLHISEFKGADKKSCLEIAALLKAVVAFAE